MSSRSRLHAGFTVLAVLFFTLPQPSEALVPKEDHGPLESLAFVSDALQAGRQTESLDEIRVTTAAGIANAWDSFRTAHGEWSAVVDQRTGRIEVVEGEGIPFIPGPGNRLQMEDLFGPGEHQKIDLAKMEAITRGFLPRVAAMLGVNPSTLVLHRGRSGQPAGYLWFVDFDVVLDGLPVEGARVVFRVNNGNLIQFGTENLPAEGTEVPRAKVTRNEALAILSDYIGGFSAADTFLDGGSQHLLPVLLAEGTLHQERGLARVWQFVFRRDGDYGTWRARVDAATGELLELRDLNDYASAQVAGGVSTLSGSQTRPMPFADLSSGGYTNSAGVYDHAGGTVTSTLNGRYVRINDSCGAISMISDAQGGLDFGNAIGTDCDTPGYGGTGNTNAARTQFYYLNRAKDIARGWLPDLSWLSGSLTASVNITGECNPRWESSSVHFPQSGPGCSNAGENPSISVHEFGHGLDANDGNGSSLDKGTGETYGDWTAALMTRDSCIGGGFKPSNCGGYGDACTACTGVRDIDYAKHSWGIPHTVQNFVQVNCVRGDGYNGPCGRKGHCESQVASEALWDFTVRDLPNPGSNSAWAIAERLWYLSRSSATASFTCITDLSPWVSDGCGVGSLWKNFRVVDDDDGNISNGTPHSAALFAAFDRHGIACPSDAGADISFRGCTQQPSPPELSLTAGDHKVTLSIPSYSTNVHDIYRNEQGCDAGGAIKVASNIQSQFTDVNVANGLRYYYYAVEHPTGNEACASDPSSCQEITPCPAIHPPATLTATVIGGDKIDLSWAMSPGATHYNLYRATTPDGPFTQLATLSGTAFSDTGLSACSTYVYEVRPAWSSWGETCEPGISTRVTTATSGPSSTCSLTVSKTGRGAGTISSSPTGLNCGVDCNERYNIGIQVILTAAPASGSVFAGWSGSCSGTGACTLAITQAHFATASFAKTYLLESRYQSSGIVTSSPAGINCGVAGLDCAERYPEDAAVTLTATPAEGYLLSHWRGSCTGYASTCVLTMTKDHTAWASFSRPLLRVYLNSQHNGQGTVTTTPDVMTCPSICYANVDAGTLVTLTATPAAGSTFTSWSGPCTGTGPCNLTMTKDLYVNALFTGPNHKLTVNSTSGGYTVSSPHGIYCSSATCSARYGESTLVALTPYPYAGYVFSKWSGDCTGTGSCTVLMTQDRLVNASYSVATPTLAVSLTGDGSGTVTSTPGAINCGIDCTETYSYNSLVTLTATPAGKAAFVGWTGACTGAGQCTLTMKQDLAVSANFSALYDLQFSVEGSGSGSVTAAPTGDSCGPNCWSYPSGMSVTLTATAAQGSVFSGWTGECAGLEACTVTMTSPRSVTAAFSITKPALVVSRSGSGNGTIASIPAGIQCGSDCTEAYLYGTVVSLTATPATGSVFSHWTNDCNGAGACTVAMTQERSVTAIFTNVYELALSLNGTGTGGVSVTPLGTSCGTSCWSYPYNTSVTLSATPAIGSIFNGWGGDCNGQGECTVTMTQRRSASATFSPEIHFLTTSVYGAGSGTVTSTPDGINCGADCSEAYSYATPVTLAANPEEGFVFSGWSEECTGTGACNVTMTQARLVKASFAVATYSLSVDLAGTASGTVSSAPAGINCADDCGEVYNHATQVTLTATPSSALVAFKGWSGACAGIGGCSIAMDQAKQVTATFDDKGQDFYTVLPCRVLDTRVTNSPLLSGVPRIINVGGTCGVPATARAVSMNVTAVMPSGQGAATLYPGDTAPPGTSTINLQPLANRANNTIMPLAWNGSGTLAALAVIAGDGTMDLILDVNGYYE